MQNPPPMYPPGGGMSSQDLRPQEDNDKIMAALCYVFYIIMSVVILATDMKNKPFLKYHAYQSLVFGGILFIAWIVASLLAIVIVGFCLMPILFLVPFYYAYLAYARGVFTIPLVTDLTARLFSDFPAPNRAA